MPFPAMPVWRNTSTRRQCWDCWRQCIAILEKRLPELTGRSRRVEAVANAIATAMSLTEEAIYSLRLSAAFHDVGLLAVPDREIQLDRLIEGVLPPNLLPHVIYGSRLIHHAFPDFPEAVEAIWYHHEWIDGRGPFKLEGERIPMFARIITVADVLEYRVCGDADSGPADFGQAIKQVCADVGTRFDPTVVTALRSVADDVHEILTSTTVGSGEETCAISRTGSDREQACAADTSTKPIRARIAEPTGNVERHHAAVKTLRTKKAVCETNDLMARMRSFDAPESWSPAIQGVLRVTQSSGCSARDVAKAVAQDPLLSMRVLRISNNSPFARKRNVDTILDAVTVLGINEIRNLAVTCQVFDRLNLEESSQIDPSEFWEHSAACGLIAASFQNEGTGVDPFVCGILHDAGRLLLMRVAPDEYAEVFSLSQELDLPLDVVENRLLGTTHAAILGEMMKHWGFGERLRSIVSRHHDSVESIKRLPKDMQHEVAIIALSNRIAHALSMGASGNERLYSIEGLVEILGLDAEHIDAAVESTMNLLPSMRAVMANNTQPSATADSNRASRVSLTPTAVPLIVSDPSQLSSLDLWRRGILEDPTNDRPTIAIAHIDSSASTNKVMRMLIDHEKSADVADLPLVIVSSATSIGECPELGNREFVVLRSPVRCELLVEQINQLLQADPSGTN